MNKIQLVTESAEFYGELIDADNNPSTGKYGVDYQQELQWSSETHVWNKLIVENSSPVNLRIMKIERTTPDFFKITKSTYLCFLILNL